MIKNYVVRTRGLSYGIYNDEDIVRMRDATKHEILRRDPSAAFSSEENPVTFWVATVLPLSDIEGMPFVIDALPSYVDVRREVAEP